MENELEQLFSKYGNNFFNYSISFKRKEKNIRLIGFFSPLSLGQLAELYLPIDRITKKALGFAFVSYLFPEHAVKAFSELDGTIFQVKFSLSPLRL